jgi:hypothetical protein
MQDVDYAPAPLIPALSPISGAPLDMSRCLLRSASPIHVQNLKNIGVRATLVVSLMVGGKLWGLLSCDHYTPRFMHFEQRALCEILAEAVATRIAALESFARCFAELGVRRLEQRLIAAISAEGDWQGALFDGSTTLPEPVAATGAALLFEGQSRPVGDIPATAALRAIGSWLDRRDGSLIGIGAVILNGARTSRNCLIAAMSFVGEGKQIPDNALVRGIPGKVVGEVTAEQAARMRAGTAAYVRNWRRYRDGSRMDHTTRRSGEEHGE